MIRINIKKFINDHKPEILVIGVTTIALTTGVIVHLRMKNFVEFSDTLIHDIKEYGHVDLKINGDHFQVSILD